MGALFAYLFSLDRAHFSDLLCLVEVCCQLVSFGSRGFSMFAIILFSLVELISNLIRRGDLGRRTSTLASLVFPYSNLDFSFHSQALAFWEI